MSKIIFVGPSAEPAIDIEEDEIPCKRCPYNPIDQLIRSGGEDICPDAFKEIAKHCNYNYNRQKRSDDC